MHFNPFFHSTCFHSQRLIMPICLKSKTVTLTRQSFKKKKKEDREVDKLEHFSKQLQMLQC